jgi:hypothetical protein
MTHLDAPRDVDGPTAGKDRRPPGQRSRRAALRRQVTELVRAIDDGDEATIERAVRQLSRSRRIFAPLAFAVGAFVMLFQGVKLLFSNWRLTLIQLLPAMWIWLALLDLKLHVLKGHEFHVWHGTVETLLVAAIAIITAASFYLNAVFAFAIARPGKPEIRPAFALARRHLGVVLGVGLVVGVALGISAVVLPRFGFWWFAISLSVVIGVMMLVYVSVPARLIGARPIASRRDKLAAAALGGALGALVCTPPYMIGRIGILLLGSDALFAVGVILLVIGLTLQAGATGAVKAIKMSAKLVAGGGTAPTAASPRPKAP